MEFLFLTTPEHHAAKNNAVELNAKRLKQWLDALPIMDITETVISLHTTIEPFNEIQLSNDERLKLLETYYVVIDEILFSYDDMRITMLPISLKERRHLKNDIMWLYLSLANGYKSVVKSGFEKNVNPKKDNVLLVSIYRSMELIIQAMLYAFRSHETPPPLVYLEINQLYMFAEFHKVLDNKIKINKSKNCLTIGSLYKQILLLIASDPYRVNSNELIEIYFFIENFANLCVIQKGVECQGEEGQYFIDLMEDMPPLLCEREKKKLISSSYRTIDVWPVVQAFGKDISEKKAIGDLGSNKLNLEQRFSEILTQQLMGKKNRKSDRQIITNKCYVAIGLSAINFYSMNKDKIKEVMEPEETGGIMVNNLDFEEQANFTLDVWQLCNKSDTGYLLQIRKNILTQELIIGDVIGIIIENEKGSISLNVAFIRWVRGDDDICKMGVEILIGKAIPVVCHCYGDHQSYEGLYFPRSEHGDIQGRLLVEQSILMQFKKYNITVGSHNFEIEYISSVIETSLYSQFKYKEV